MRKTLKTISKTLGGGNYRQMRQSTSYLEEDAASWARGEGEKDKEKLIINYKLKEYIYSLDYYRKIYEDEMFEKNEETENFKKNFRKNYRMHFTRIYNTKDSNGSYGDKVYKGDLTYKNHGKKIYLILIKKGIKKDELEIKIALNEIDNKGWYIKGEEDVFFGKKYYNVCDLYKIYYLAYYKETPYDKNFNQSRLDFDTQCGGRKTKRRSKTRKNRRSRKI
jgi:hypothetical protein